MLAYMKFVFSVSENGENGLSDEGTEGGNATPEFWARTAPAYKLGYFKSNYTDN